MAFNPKKGSKLLSKHKQHTGAPFFRFGHYRKQKASEIEQSRSPANFAIARILPDRKKESKKALYHDTVRGPHWRSCVQARRTERCLHFTCLFLHSDADRMQCVSVCLEGEDRVGSHTDFRNRFSKAFLSFFNAVLLTVLLAVLLARTWTAQNLVPRWVCC